MKVIDVQSLGGEEDRTLFDDVHPGLSADVLLEGTRKRSVRRGLLRTAPDVITFVITFPVAWPASGNDQIRDILPRVSGIKQVGAIGITTKETDRKKVQRLADEYERASRANRTLKQAQSVLDLHEEHSDGALRFSVRDN